MKTHLRRRDQIGVFDVVNTLLMLILVFITLYPFYHIVCASFSDNTMLSAHKGMLFWPQGFTVAVYKLTFTHPLIWSGYRNILIILAVALPYNMLLTLFCGYFMSCQGMMFKKIIVGLILFTMFFGGGLIPSYLNMRQLGLYNNLWALIIPTGVGIYSAIVIRSSIDGIPKSLFEAAEIDGANDIYILFRIIPSLIMPTLAVVLLWFGVGHWNSWFPATIYIKDNDLLPIQAVLRSVLIANQKLTSDIQVENDHYNSYAEVIKYAIIVIGTLPILCVYPFLQKYFVKGVMIGAVKG
jgi:ABC-type sugar transport system, permease component